MLVRSKLRLPRWFEVLHLELRVGDELPSKLSQLTSTLDVGEGVLQQWESRTLVVDVDSLGAVLEEVTGFVADQRLVDVDEIAVIVCVEEVDDLHHIDIGNVSERPLHVVVQESSRQEGRSKPPFHVSPLNAVR